MEHRHYYCKTRQQIYLAEYKQYVLLYDALPPTATLEWSSADGRISFSSVPDSTSPRGRET
jgi:hypothetical protein